MKEHVNKVKLLNVCDFQGGSQPPKNEWSKEERPGYVRMLQIRDFTQSATDYIEYVKISNRLKYCTKNDVLIGRYGASVGKILSGLEGAYNVAIMKTIPDTSKLSTSFLKYYFLSPYFQHNLLKSSLNRAAQAGFSKEDLSDIEIPVPPLSEQQQIVEELDLLSGIIEKKKEQLKELDNLAQSIFYDMFGDPVTNEKGWEKKQLSSFCSIATGSTPDRKNSEYYNGDIPWVKTTEVNYNNIYSTEENISELGLKNSNCRVFPCDSILMAMYGQGKTRGQVAVLKIAAATNQACAAIMHNGQSDTTFLYSELKLMYDDIRNLAQGCNQSNLNLKIVGKIEVILPPLPLQQSFASKIEAIEKQKALIKQSITETETLFNSRMDYYFG